MKKSKVLKRNKINESFLKKINRDKDFDIKKIINDYEESKKESLDFAISNFLENVCKQEPREISVPVINSEGKEVKDNDGEIVFRRQTVHSFNYQVLANAITKIVKKFKPDSLPKGEFLKIGLSPKEENTANKNILYLKERWSGEIVAKYSKLSDWDVENMKEDSVFCARWVKKIIIFYLVKILGFSTEEQKIIAKFIISNELELSQPLQESFTQKTSSTSISSIKSKADQSINRYNELAEKLLKFYTKYKEHFNNGFNENDFDTEKEIIEIGQFFNQISTEEDRKEFIEKSIEPLLCINSLGRTIYRTIKYNINSELRTKIDEITDDIF